MKRVQIIVREKASGRWKFIAHGAPYTLEEAADFKTRYLSRNEPCRFLPLGKVPKS